MYVLLVVCSEKTVVTEKGEESIARILFFDDGNFQLISSFELDYLEQGISITTCQLEGCPRPLIIVGTAQVVNDEAEPSKGRVLVFDILSSHNEEKKVNLLTEKETKSGVYSLVGVSGKLAAGIGSKVSPLIWIGICIRIYAHAYPRSSLTLFSNFVACYRYKSIN